MVPHISECEENHKRPLEVTELISKLLLKLTCYLKKKKKNTYQFYLKLNSLVFSLQISDDGVIPGPVLCSSKQLGDSCFQQGLYHVTH